MRAALQSDWNAYYTEAEFDVPPFIIQALWRNYEAVLRRHLGPRPGKLVVMELGGADSCFYHLFRAAFPVAEYHIVDNNRIGLERFPYAGDPGTALHEVDLLGDPAPQLGIAADIVFSAGLIEHFTPQDTAAIAKAHFLQAKPGGLVMMSFPTPTVMYWTFRRLLEWTGKFPPLFERPIRRKEFHTATAGLGSHLETVTIHATILTQLLMLMRRT